jgi:hypothetical protein
MANFLIEVPHGANKIDCKKAMEVFEMTGSHFLANADWGCEDSEHKAWMVVDVDSKEQALQIVPPLYRNVAKIIKLFKISRKDVEHSSGDHRSDAPDLYHI